jgi:hypothetical protein
MKPFNPYAAGNKHYGAGRAMPTIGPVASPEGYAERDNRAKARMNAIQRRMKAGDQGNPTASAVMGYATKGVFS